MKTYYFDGVNSFWTKKLFASDQEAIQYAKDGGFDICYIDETMPFTVVWERESK